MYLLNQAVDYILDGEYILFTFHYVSIKSDSLHKSGTVLE